MANNKKLTQAPWKTTNGLRGTMAPKYNALREAL